MKRSQRGAAKVSVIWLVGLVVAFLIALVMFFLTNQVATQQQEELAAKNRRIAELETQGQERTSQVLAISKKLGFAEEASASNLEAADKMLADAIKATPDADTGAKDFQSYVRSVIPVVAAKDQRLKDLQKQLDDAIAENRVLSGRMNDALAAAEKEKGDLRSQLQDAQSSASDTKTDLERQIGEARENYKQSDLKVNKLTQEMVDLRSSFDQDKLALQARMDEQGRKLNPFTKEPERVDGKILDVSKDSTIGWIDIGSKQRLAAGTRFRVVSGAHGAKTVKAWAEVSNVQGSMAEVHFYGRTDPFDPPVAGDVVFNPLFDPRGERAAVLVGRFTGANMSQKEVEGLLQGMGITVQKKVDKSTDFLIVGGEMYTDENNQPVETPVQPSDLPIYKDAVAQGVQIVLLKDLRQYFAF